MLRVLVRRRVTRTFERLSDRRFDEVVLSLAPDVHHRFGGEGPPWDLRVAVEWTAHVRPAAGDPYENCGAHVLRVVRGRVTELHAYEDSQLVARACEQMAAAGITEAAAAPVTAA